MGVLATQSHRRIFSLFLDHHELSYADIAKATGMRSNLLNYHLKPLLADGMLEKQDDQYRVTPKGEYFLPHFKHLQGEERLKLPVVLFAIEHRGKILLIKRDKRPYQDYWSLPGGKVRYDESIEDAMKRISLRETGMDVKLVKVCSIIDERVQDGHTIKNGWWLFLAQARPAKVKQLPSNCDWFDPAELDGRIIPSDKWMIQNSLKEEIKVTNVLVEESDGRIVDFKRF